MPLTINGLDDLYNDMTAMAGAVGNESQVIDKALKAGAVPIEEQMKAIEQRLSAPGPQDDIMELTRDYLEHKRELDIKMDQWSQLDI